ncbi:hypothetical protein Bra3105_05925 [Brachybacterium halotolerans subsp. kimchii]|uniref:hypothetical protein n=1 Tax=Brachybacterium halotolerans TaxID=2795215 RepID=UPI001E59F7AF|nr:hypothetical protein [Brachybacterium halotolerans]UEJ83850.1 hypothetical protein Bra3105_05925 [Brachybacterium halotolerans subsp. kimchii]
MTSSTSAPADPSADVPFGVGTARTPDGPIDFTEFDVASALAVLRRRGQSDGPVEILTLSDEQIIGLDGAGRSQLTELPWVQDHASDRELLAAAGLRSLLATGAVSLSPVHGAEGADGAGGTDDAQQGDAEPAALRWVVDPAIDGCLVLRRTADVLCGVERQVRGDDGLQTHRLYHYVHTEGVLEEEVTASGMHVFRSLSVADVPARIVHLADPDHAARTASEPEVLPLSELDDAGQLSQQLADARAISLLTSLDTTTDAVKQLTLYATPDAVLLMETGDPESEDPEVMVRAVDAAQLSALAAWFIGGEE